MPGWIAVFRGIPWMELIVAAPAIARGARKLWTGIRRPAPDTQAGAPLDPEERLARLESQVDELKKDLAASSEIIKAMAEQNEKLLGAVGILRARVRLLLGLSGVALALGVGLAIKLWVG